MVRACCSWRSQGRIITWSFPVFRGCLHLLSEAFLPSEPGTATYVPQGPMLYYFCSHCDLGPLDCTDSAWRLISSLDSSCNFNSYLPRLPLVIGYGDQWVPQGLHWKIGSQFLIKAPAIPQTLSSLAMTALLSTQPAWVLSTGPLSQVLALQNWPGGGQCEQ